MSMVQLRALAKENNLRGYSRLRKNDLINMIFESSKVISNESKDENKDENKTIKLTKNKRKNISQKASKLSNKSNNLIDINDLKSQRMI